MQENTNTVESDVKIGENAGTTYSIVGTVETNKIYNFIETYDDSKYTWYKLNDGQWVANTRDNSFLNIYLSKEDDIVIEELKSTIFALNTQINTLNDKIVIQQETIDSLNDEKEQDKTKVLLNFDITQKGTYAVSCNEGEKLIIIAN